MLNITVLISGGGTNLQALLDHFNSNNTDNASTSSNNNNAKVTHVISNRKNAFGLTRAHDANVPTTYHNLVAYKKRQTNPDDPTSIQKAREEYDRDLAEIILNHDNGPSTEVDADATAKQSSSEGKPTRGPDLVVCAGWMHILSEVFISALRDRDVVVINLHPALPGQFNGAEAIQRAYAAFQRGEIASTGVMVHHVIGEVDMGEPVLVREVECKTGEAESDLEARIHEVEWKLIVEATVKVLGEIEEGKRKGKK